MSPIFPARAPRRPLGRFSDETPLFILIVVLCAAVSALAAIGPLSGVFSHVSIDYGEGWNAYWAAAAMGAGPLYSKTHILVADNYPPLSFYLSGIVGELVGDNVFAGRLIATVSLLAVATLIGIIVRKFGAPLRWALAAAILFLSYDILYFSQFVAVNNPQWLGQAVMLSGLLPLLRETRPLPKGRVAISAAIMVMGGLVKHNQIALPLAVTLWLLIEDRRAFGAWIVAGLGCAALACALLFVAYGSAVFVELLTFKRTTDMVNFISGLRKVGCFIALAGVALLSLPMRRKDHRWLLFAFYAVFGVVLGALQRLGSGVYINAHFDALIALVILCGIFLGKSARDDQGPGRRQRSVLLLILVAPLAIVAVPHIKRSLRELHMRAADSKAWDGMIADVRHARDPVLCEVPVVCYWAGKPFTLDFFAYGQRLRTGSDPSPLARFVTARRASLLILDPGYDRESGQGRLPEPFPAMMRSRYHIVQTVPGEIEERAPDVP